MWTASILESGLEVWHRAYRRARAFQALLVLRRRARASRRRAGGRETHRGINGINPEVVSIHAVDARQHRIAGALWWIPSDNRKEGSLSARLLRGVLPIDELLQTRPFIRKGVMVDIGANIGTTAITRLLLGHVDYVFALEPDPVNYACLVRTVRDNQLDDRTCVDHVALGAYDGQATLMRADGIGRHRLIAEPSRRRGNMVPVKAMTLDSWAIWRGCDPHRVTYVKCDTQGWEGHVLRGAPCWLSHKHITWEVEICPRLLEKAGSNLADLCGLLQEHFQWFVELRAARWNPRRMPTSDLLPVVEHAITMHRSYTNVILGN